MYVCLCMLVSECTCDVFCVVCLYVCECVCVSVCVCVFVYAGE